MTDFTDPCRFAALCATIGYMQDKVVDTLVEQGHDRAEMTKVVEVEYQKFAAREAEDAAVHFTT